MTTLLATPSDHARFHSPSAHSNPHMDSSTDWRQPSRYDRHDRPHDHPDEPTRLPGIHSVLNGALSTSSPAPASSPPHSSYYSSTSHQSQPPYSSHPPAPPPQPPHPHHAPYQHPSYQPPPPPPPPPPQQQPPPPTQPYYAPAPPLSHSRHASRSSYDLHRPQSDMVYGRPAIQPQPLAASSPYTRPAWNHRATPPRYGSEYYPSTGRRPSYASGEHDLSTSPDPNGRYNGHQHPSDYANPLPRPGATEHSSRADGAPYGYPSAPTHPDGHPVRADFGMTKAGKPRKRLAQACLTCREKKIRCDFRTPKCSQCEKVGKECKRPVSDNNHAAKRPLESPEPAPHRQPPAPFAGRDEPERPGTGTSSELARAPQSGAMSGDASHSTNSDMMEWRRAHSSAPSGVSVSSRDGLATAVFHEARDPYELQPALTLELLEQTYLHAAQCPYPTVPLAFLIRWATNGKAKRPEDIMVLYAFLAMGATRSLHAEHNALIPALTTIARSCAERGALSFSVQLAQSQLLLGLVTFAAGNDAAAYCFLGSSLRTLTALGYNTEAGLEKNTGLETFDLEPNQLIECRRRLFWAAYLTGRYTGYCGGTSNIIHDQDVFIRLPGTEAEFEENVPSTRPFLHNGVKGPSQTLTVDSGEQSELASSIVLASIWGQINEHAFRAPHMSDKDYAARYSVYYQSICEQLSLWETITPSSLRYSSANTARALREGSFGSYLTLQAIVCIVQMKLHRVAYYGLLDPPTLRRNLRQARHYAKRLMVLLRTAHDADSDSSNGSVSADGSPSASAAAAQPEKSIEAAFSHPFVGYAILCASDILSVRGLEHNLEAVQSDLTCAKYVTDRIGRIWKSSQKRAASIKDRMVVNLSLKLREQSSSGAWRHPSPMEPSTAHPTTHADDIFFSTPDDVFYEALEARDD